MGLSGIPTSAPDRLSHNGYATVCPLAHSISLTDPVMTYKTMAFGIHDKFLSMRVVVGAWPAMTTLGTASVLVMTTTEEFYTKKKEREGEGEKNGREVKRQMNR